MNWNPRNSTRNKLQVQNHYLVALSLQQTIDPSRANSVIGIVVSRAGPTIDTVEVVWM
jgi:hypothetical protein